MIGEFRSILLVSVFNGTLTGGYKVTFFGVIGGFRSILLVSVFNGALTRGYKVTFIGVIGGFDPFCYF